MPLWEDLSQENYPVVDLLVSRQAAQSVHVKPSVNLNLKKEKCLVLDCPWCTAESGTIIGLVSAVSEKGNSGTKTGSKIGSWIRKGSMLEEWVMGGKRWGKGIEGCEGEKEGYEMKGKVVSWKSTSLETKFFLVLRSKSL